MIRRKQSFVLAAAAVWFAASASGQIQLVRVTECSPGAFPGRICNIPATGSGNLIVVAWRAPGASSTNITQITDNAGNVYARAGNSRAANSGSDYMVDVWYAKNSKSGASAVTITPSASVGDGAGVIWEFSGVDTVSPLGQSAVLNSQAATTAPNGASVTTTTPGELIISVLITAGQSGIRSGNPFVNDSTLTGDGYARFIAATAGAYRAQWNSANSTFANSTVSFKAANGSNPPPATPLNECDLTDFGAVTSADMNAAVNMSLGITPCTANIVGAGVCNVVVVQRVVNAALGGNCVVGTAVPHSVDLTWVASPSAGVTGYNVYRASTTGGPYSLLNASPLAGTTYTDSAVQSGQTYYYVVKAKSATEESGPSNEATAVIPNP